jgi:hypothetical protein
MHFCTKTAAGVLSICKPMENTMQTNTFDDVNKDTSAFAAIMNKGMNSSGLPPALNVFRPKTKESTHTKEVADQSKLPPSVKAAVETAQLLVIDYAKLKVEVLDRSDRALWEMLQAVYGFVQQIEAATSKLNIRNELIKQIQLRDKQGMATNSCTEAIVVRYVFGDQSRQSRNNYTIAMEKARTLGIDADAFADFLSENGGVGKVVEKIFDFEEAPQSPGVGRCDQG